MSEPDLFTVFFIGDEFEYQITASYEGSGSVTCKLIDDSGGGFRFDSASTVLPGGVTAQCTPGATVGTLTCSGIVLDNAHDLKLSVKGHVRWQPGPSTLNNTATMECTTADGVRVGVTPDKAAVLIDAPFHFTNNAAPAPIAAAAPGNTGGLVATTTNPPALSLLQPDSTGKLQLTKSTPIPGLGSPSYVNTDPVSGTYTVFDSNQVRFFDSSLTQLGSTVTLPPRGH